MAGLFGNIDGITNCAWLTSSHSIAIPSYYECVHPSCPGELFCNEWSCAEGGGELVGGSNISSLEEYGLGTDSELASEFYSRDHNVYSNWDSNWVWSESNYPILSWQ